MENMRKLSFYSMKMTFHFTYTPKPKRSKLGQ
jgi:hypothetical protein